MTREEIKKIGLEAGISQRALVICEVFFPFLSAELASEEAWQQVERFAALVAAAEREACARVCRDLGRGHDVAFAEYDCVEAIRARGEE